MPVGLCGGPAGPKEPASTSQRASYHPAAKRVGL